MSAQRPAWASQAAETVRPLRDALPAVQEVGAPDAAQTLELGGVYQKAYDEAQRAAQASVDAVVQRYHHAIVELDELRRRVLAASKTSLVELALDIAREVLLASVEERRA